MSSRVPAPAAALAVAVAVLAAAEAAARVALARDPLPDAYAVKCISTHQRGFPEYTRPPAERPPGRLVIVLSNSQGQVTWNEPDPGPTLFPAILEERLGPGTRVLNWSIVGGSGSELAVLAARAAAHRPDAVVLVAGSLNFLGDSATKPLAEAGSDVESLAYLPDVRRLLPERFLRRHSVHEVPGWLSGNTDLVRWRHRYVEKRAGNWFSTTAFLADRVFLADVASGRIGPGRLGERSLDGEWTADSDALLEDLRAALRAGAPEARLVVVSQPVCWFRYDAGSQRRLEAMAPAARRLFADDPAVTVVELLREIPPERFFTWSHVGPVGHRMLADLLVPHVRRALER